MAEQDKPCFHHLWVELPSTAEHEMETGRATYTICAKCNSIKPDPPLEPA